MTSQNETPIPVEKTIEEKEKELDARRQITLQFLSSLQDMYLNDMSRFDANKDAVSFTKKSKMGEVVIKIGDVFELVRTVPLKIVEKEDKSLPHKHDLEKIN